MVDIDDIKGKTLDFSEDSKKEIPLVEEASRELMTEYQFMTIEETDEIWYYDNGVYVPGGEKLIAKKAEEIYEYELTKGKLSEITAHIMRKTYVKHKEIDADINTINLENGLYDIENDRLLEHTPAYYSINQKPIRYNKDAKPKRFLKFLQEVLFPKDILTAIDAMAYTFHRDCMIETIFILFGLGNNGKTVFTSLLTALHGADNISNVPLTEMLSDKFALSDLESKDVNIDNELAGQTIKESAIIRRLTGGSRQRIRIQRKNQQAYDTTLYSKLFFNANRMPDSEDTSDAYNRRIIIIAFPNRFEGKTEDKQLISKLTEESEISGIFNILMRSLKRIKRDREIYVNEKTIEEKRLKYEITTHPIQSFIDAAIVRLNGVGGIEKEELYKVYEKYCSNHSIPPERYNSFCGKLKNDFDFKDERITQPDKSKVAYWKDIIVAPEYAPETEQKTMDNILP